MQSSIKSAATYIGCCIFISNAGCISPHNRAFNLTLCTMLRNEMPDILEWIEHYRLQGVDRIILYEDDSFDDTLLIPTLYQLRGVENFIQMYPANAYRRNVLPPHNGDHHMWKQVMAFDHCSHRSIGTSHWAMVVDLDEFMYSPNYGTIWAFLESIKNQTSDPLDPNPWSNIYVDPIRYGTSGLKYNFIGQIEFDPLNNTVQVSVSNPNTDDPAYPLYTVSNPSRSPNHNLDQDHAELFDKICKDDRYHAYCEPGFGKAIWKPEHCDFGHIHSCGTISKGHSRTANIHDLRMNHYALKSVDHVDGLLETLLKPGKLNNFRWDASWFSMRYDPMPENMTRLILNGINKIMLA